MNVNEMDPDALEELRVLASDLAEHWLERTGREEGFAVWQDDDDDDDVRCFTDEAQDRWNGASDAIERELLHFVQHGRDEGVVIEALAQFASADAIRKVLAKL